MRKTHRDNSQKAPSHDEVKDWNEKHRIGVAISNLDVTFGTTAENEAGMKAAMFNLLKSSCLTDDFCTLRQDLRHEIVGNISLLYDAISDLEILFKLPCIKHDLYNTIVGRQNFSNQN